MPRPPRPGICSRADSRGAEVETGKNFFGRELVGGRPRAHGAAGSQRACTQYVRAHARTVRRCMRACTHTPTHVHAHVHLHSRYMHVMQDSHNVMCQCHFQGATDRGLRCQSIPYRYLLTEETTIDDSRTEAARREDGLWQGTVTSSCGARAVSGNEY